MTPSMKDVLDAYREWGGVPGTPLWLEMLLVLASRQAEEIERLSAELRGKGCCHEEE